MKYSEKARARTRPFVYDKDSKAFNQGAHRHWWGRTTEDGFLNTHGKRSLEFDVAAFINRVIGKGHRHVYD
jgi:hypothetical protein